MLLATQSAVAPLKRPRIGLLASKFTDLKQTHERIIASHKLETLGVMAAGVAHDFGNVLGAIMAEADLALSEMAHDAATRENIERISEVAAHGAEIVEMLMACVGAGNSVVAFGPVDLAYEVERMLRLLTKSISKRALVRTSLPSGLPPVFGNVSQIHQIVLNLITNASDALGDQPGLIAVSAETTGLESRGGKQSIEMPGGEYVRLTVSDTGCGMTDATRDRIFDPFFTTKATGRGLGLAAVDSIVRSHGGAICVESVMGTGTTFYIWFPCTCSAGRAGIRADAQVP